MRNLSFSLRSKRFCGFSEQRKTEERKFDNFAAQEMGTIEKIERGGRGYFLLPVSFADWDFRHTTISNHW